MPVSKQKNHSELSGFFVVFFDLYNLVAFFCFAGNIVKRVICLILGAFKRVNKEKLTTYSTVLKMHFTGANGHVQG